MAEDRSQRVQFANTLRGIASVSVLIAHYTGAFWSPNREFTANLIHAPALPFEQHGFPVYLMWLHTVPYFNWASFGVGLFFLVSGFVITLSLRKMTWQAFLVGRFFRIVPLYVCGFSVTLLAIWLVGRYFGVPWPFAFWDVAVQYFPGPRPFLWVPSIDGIVWTLEIEIMFYVVCAFAVVWLRRRSLLAFLVPFIIAGTAFYIMATLPEWGNAGQTAFHIVLAIQWAAPFLVFMFIGVTFCYLHDNLLRWWQAYLLVALLFALFSMLAGAGSGIQAGDHFARSYSFPVMFFVFAVNFPTLFRSTRLGDFFARISYPLYVIHGVAGYAAMRVLMDLGAPAWLTMALVTLGILLLAWLLHVFVEEPTNQFGKRIAKAMTVSKTGQRDDRERAATVS